MTTGGQGDKCPLWEVKVCLTLLPGEKGSSLPTFITTESPLFYAMCWLSTLFRTEICSDDGGPCKQR
jgi:hypothetical protein